MTELWAQSAVEMRDLIWSGQASPREVADVLIRRAATVDEGVGALTLVAEERAFADADRVERALAQGNKPTLAGVPYTVKDLTETAGLRTTYGSRAFADHVPHEDAAVARRLREAGGILVGKTNTPEFGSRATTAYGLFPPTHNPWSDERTAGGSSGGAAAAVAIGIGPVAHGTDGGGSIRIPSSCCGVVGLKPSRGRISNAPEGAPRAGLVTHGPIGRRIADVALMLDVMAGQEPGDPYWLETDAGEFLAAATQAQELDRKRVGVLLESDQSVSAEVQDAAQAVADTLSNVGHDVSHCDLDLAGLGGIFRVLMEAESAATAPRELNYSDPYNEWSYKRGVEISASTYLRALAEMHAMCRRIALSWGGLDCLVTPTLTMEPPLLGEFLAVTERVAEDDLAFIPFTYPFNMTGQPAISLPLGRSTSDLPIGVQLVGRPGGDAGLLGLAAELERLRPWHDRWPVPVETRA